MDLILFLKHFIENDFEKKKSADNKNHEKSPSIHDKRVTKFGIIFEWEPRSFGFTMYLLRAEQAGLGSAVAQW